MESSIRAWVEAEFDGIELGDQRLNARFKDIATQLAKQLGKTIASSFTYWKEIKAAYRFFANHKVTEAKMLAPHIEQSVDRVRAHRRVLLLQDTTYLDFTDRTKTEGLDVTHRHQSSTLSKGLMLHNTLAVSETGIPLGLLDQRFIDRKQFHGKNHEECRQMRHSNRAIEEKESVRWLDIIKGAQQYDVGDTEIIHVADRESDIYELFRDAIDLEAKVLIRASKNRAINKETRREVPSIFLFDHLHAQKEQGVINIQLQVNDKHKFRAAKVSIMFTPISMPAPPDRTVEKDGAHLPMVPLYAIMASEKTPPPGHAPICWVLLTNLAVTTLEEAVEKVNWYSYRWNIEVFHKILKSGCGVEKAQLRQADRLKKYVVLKSIMAWRIFWLTRTYEAHQEENCLTVLTDDEWPILYRKIKKSRYLPPHPPTVGEIFMWIAKLGGHIGRRSDAPPGVISLWRGWQRFTEMVDDYHDICG